ncbi:TPA: hypothetical protein RG647_RS11800, partial [Providencia rettgeri]|nr:hypothetical protein [Providencia rettgeri]
TAADAAGNVSAVDASGKITIDTTPPQLVDTQVNIQDNNHNNKVTLNFSGMAESNSSIKITINDQDVTSKAINVDSQGKWSFKSDDYEKLNVYQYKIDVMDTAGNIHSAGGEISASEQIILPVQGSSRMMPDTLIHEVNNMVIEDETYF